MKPRRFAQGLRRRTGVSATEPLHPLSFLETALPVACVLVPDLCLLAACRYIVRFAGMLPPGLQAMVDAAGPGEGRPVRGICIALRGHGLLLADEKDTDDEQRFSLMHEGAHFVLDHLIPREEALRRMGEAIRPVLDGQRAPTVFERFDAVVRGADLAWHSHLYYRNAPYREIAEDDADALACLLIAPADALQGQKTVTEETLVRGFRLPPSEARMYAGALRVMMAPPPARTKNPLLRRLGI